MDTYAVAQQDEDGVVHFFVLAWCIGRRFGVHILYFLRPVLSPVLTIFTYGQVEKHVYHSCYEMYLVRPSRPFLVVLKRETEQSFSHMTILVF
jgi:hypothetical protein